LPFHQKKKIKKKKLGSRKSGLYPTLAADWLKVLKALKVLKVDPLSRPRSASDQATQERIQLSKIFYL